jgi:hypothetical protein
LTQSLCISIILLGGLTDKDSRFFPLQSPPVIFRFSQVFNFVVIDSIWYGLKMFVNMHFMFMMIVKPKEWHAQWFKWESNCTFSWNIDKLQQISNFMINLYRMRNYNWDSVRKLCNRINKHCFSLSMEMWVLYFFRQLKTLSRKASRSDKDTTRDSTTPWFLCGSWSTDRYIHQNERHPPLTSPETNH